MSQGDVCAAEIRTQATDGAHQRYVLPMVKKDTQFTEYLSDQFVRNMDGELVGELDYGT